MLESFAISLLVYLAVLGAAQFLRFVRPAAVR